MSRIEKKFIINNQNEKFFYNWLKSQTKVNLYPDRKILNIYYDSNKLESYTDAIEGVRPRKKVRLRFYNNFKSCFIKLSDFSSLNCNFENKVTDFDRNYKIKRKMIFNHHFSNFYDKKYFFLKPKFITEYKRSYYAINECRITLDYNLNFYKINENSSISKKITKLSKILEFKLSMKNYNEAFNNFEINPTRYSKYLDAVNSFKKDKFKENFLVI